MATLDVGGVEMIQGFDMLGKSLGKDQKNGDEQPIWPAIFDVTWKSRCWLVMRWLMCTLFCSGIAEAGVVNDPTVPPAEWLALQPTPAGKAASVVGLVLKKIQLLNHE